MATPTDLVADRYRLVRTIGSGGMGRVWLAVDNILHRDVAIKEVIPPIGLSPGEQDDLGNRTLREARTAAQLTHPNVVRIYDVIRTEQQPWIVMEYVPSRSLHQVVNEEGPLAPERVARIGLEVLGALQAAHRAGVLHRDVKPANVLLADDGRVVLGDFGLATFEGGDGTVSRPGLILGSPQYIAPERAMAGLSLPESDLWSLGATMYAAVEGRSPYARSTAIATLTALATEGPDAMERAGPLKPALNGLLRKDPQQRASVADTERLLFRAAGILDRRSRNWALPMQRRSRESSVSAVLSAPATQAGDAARSVHARALPVAGPGGGNQGDGAVGGVIPAFLPAPSQPAGPNQHPRTAAADGRPAPDESLTEVVTRPVDHGLPQGRATAPPTDVGAEPTVVQRRVGRRPRQWAAMVAVGVALVILAAVLVNGARRPQADARTGAVTASTAASVGATGGTPAGSAAPATVPPTVAATPTRVVPAPPATPGPATVVLPPGWHRYTDQTGFQVGVPQHWEVSRRGTMAYFRDPVEGRVIGIDQTNQPKPDPVADWTAQEQRRVANGDFPRYTRVSIAPVPFWRSCADWEFTYTDPGSGTRLHALNRGFITSPTRAYAIFWLTPDATWSPNRPFMDIISASFQPAA